ncbi:thiolase family protein [Caldivirga sp.]|uniref:thiolase family protein n=1 Tax=Caldivirga sp. TaxID=2080243 RepID=UPI0025C64C22|nr:thiolase family protein [Caldivirga sp.]
MSISALGYINGVHIIPPGRYYDKGYRELFAEAALKALESAGNPDIKAIYIASALSELAGEQMAIGNVLRDYSGIRNAPSIRVENGDGSGGFAFMVALNHVASMNDGCVLLVGVDKPHEVTSLKQNKYASYLLDSDYESYFGATPVVLAALMAKQYMRSYEYKYEDLATWAIKMHERGSKTPFAYFKKAAKLKDVLDSELVADPLRLYDVSPFVDGAAALVLCSKPNSKDQAVGVLGYGFGASNSYFASRNDYTVLMSVTEAVKALNPLNDFNGIVSVHDTYSILGVLALESLGLCKRGSALRLLNEGYFDPGGKVMVNLDGGLKAVGNSMGASGVYQLASVTMQLRGDKPFNGLNAEAAVVEDMVGVDQESVVFMLKVVK